MWKSYLRLLETRPLLTQCVSSGLLGAGGDAISQKIIEQKSWEEYSVVRSGRFFLLTGAYIAPVLIKWFRFLERIKGNPKIVPLKRLFIDQAVFAPAFSATVLYNLRLLEGEDFGKAYRSLKRDFRGIYLASIVYWPSIQLFNFYCIPLNFRVIVVQIASLFWNAFLSYRTQASSPVVIAQKPILQEFDGIASASHLSQG